MLCLVRCFPILGLALSDSDVSPKIRGSLFPRPVLLALAGEGKLARL